MSPIASTTLLRAALSGCAFACAASLVYGSLARDTFLSRLFARYVEHLDGTLRVLFKPEAGWTIALAQVGAIALVVGLHVALAFPMWWVVVIAIAVAPGVHLRTERRARIARLERQVDGFVLAFANALKTVPSPAAALQATVTLLPQPTRQEIEHVLKEMRVGSTLEQSLVAMSTRAKSRWLDVALSAVLIGLRVGGDLPDVLERTAATIREMNRLQGVVRTKTGEGRTQLWVLALFPILIVFAFNAVKPGYFDPLRQSLVGQIAVGIAGLLWLASLLVARKVLAVDV